MQKRVLLICQGSLEAVATLARVRSEIEVLQEMMGIQLHVVWLLNRRYARDPLRREWVKGVCGGWRVPYRIIYSLPLLGNGNLERLLSASVRFVFLAAYVLIKKIEVVHVHSFCGVQGAVLRLKRLFRFQTVLDMQGAHPEELSYQGANEKTLRRLNARERHILQGCDSVLCVSRAMVEHLVEKHSIKENKFFVLPCGVSKSSIGVDHDRRRQARLRLGIGEEFAVVYSGGTAGYQCIPETCQIFAGIAKRWPRVVLLVFSWGDLDVFKRCLAEAGVDSGRCHLRRLDQNELHDSLIAGDVGVLLRNDELLNRVSSPTKFSEYLAAGLPVVTTHYAGDAAVSVAREGVGTLVNLPPATDFGALMKFLMLVRSQRKEFTQKCLDYVERERVWEKYDVLYWKAIGFQNRGKAHREELLHPPRENESP